MKPFLARLGFSLTAAQTKVLRELRRDMGGAHPMRRLLQGDVGSGKTVVAACCALMALESSYQRRPDGPDGNSRRATFPDLQPLARAAGRRGAICKPAAKKPRHSEDAVAIPQLRLRTRTLTIGTHALIESGFAMERLGLVIIDEQHKFGVAQREQLAAQGKLSASAGDDRDAHPAHAGPDAVRRTGYVRD